jgi:hypothetical protein
MQQQQGAGEFPCHVRVVEASPGEDTESSPRPSRWQGEVIHCGQGVRELMQTWRRLVAENALLLTPEPEDDQVSMLACRVTEAVDASSGALQASLLYVKGQERQRVAGLLGLPRGNVAPCLAATS